MFQEKLYFTAFVLLTVLSHAAYAQDTNITISGTYSGTVLLKDTTYTITIPDLSTRTLGEYAKQKPDTKHNGFIIDLYTQTTSKTPEYRLYVFKDEWTLRKPAQPFQYTEELRSGTVRSYVPRARRGAVIDFPADTIEGKITKANNYRDRPGLTESQANQGVIDFATITIRQGMISQYPPPKNKRVPYLIENNPDFKEQSANAQKAGLDISKVLDQNFVMKCNGDYFYLLYYNSVQIPGTKHEYAIQKVKITKKYLNKNGNPIRPDQVQYLVEVFKLDGNKYMKRADRHTKCYGLGNAYKRETTVEIELGIGKIPGMFSGRKWPFKQTILYKMLQDYSPKPGLYDKVVFDFSKKYSYYFEFDKEGKHNIRHSDQ